VEDAPKPRPYDVLPGCGLAAYSFILLSGFGLGITGLVLWTWTTIAASQNAGFSMLTYGGSASPELLLPLNGSGLLLPNEVPDVFHAETPDGTSVCAVASGEIIRLSPTEHIRFPLSSIQEVKGEEGDVEIVGPQTIHCYFYPDTGEDRFRRMLARPK
jgi:hypothetical protein